MLKLCCKDYIAGRWLWLLALILYLVFALQAMSFRSGLALLFGPVIVLAWLGISDVIDERNKTAALYISLPLTRRTIVRSRYLLAAVLTFVGAAWTFGLIGLIGSFPAIGSPDALWPRLFSAEGLAGYILASAILTAVYLPLSFAFGPGKTAIVFPLVIIGAAGAAYGLERLATRVFRLAPLFTPDLARNPAAKIAETLTAIRASVGGPALLLCALALAGLASAFSLCLAVRLYERREF